MGRRPAGRQRSFPWGAFHERRRLEESPLMNLARCLMVPFVCFSAALTGCGSSQKVDTTQPEDINALAHVPGAKIYQEWQEVWSIDVRGKDVQARKVGYL